METEERIIDLTNRLETLANTLEQLIADYLDDRYVMDWREEDTLIRAYYMLRAVTCDRQRKEVR